ncbi:tetratricopeptide repeat-containing glycosyltransferase family 2 protein [Melioribacter sp. OK-6-Me]|uniref:tetratricopeptide repeat-containing glycosyltransferase family 2 protein n=1 Tax=unclassified Melioribacter TaxID=2627329 RepID=UPI003ED96F6C
MGTLTLSMIVKNEEKYLKDCLESVKNIVNEIVIVDTGSTDNTISIAKEYNAKIYNFDWINDFSAARNYALSRSTGDWILYLDADERLDTNSLPELKKILNTVTKAGYFCTVMNIDNENDRDYSIRYVRLFKNSPDIKFAGKVHEQITDSLIENGYQIQHSRIIINHIGYDIAKEEKEKKAKRNLELLIEEYNLSKSSYSLFQLGQTYYILENYDKAREIFSELISKQDFDNILKAEAYAYLAQIEHSNFNPMYAEKLMDKAIELNPRQTYYYLLMSKIYLRQQNLYKAKLYAKKAMETNKCINKNELFNKQTIFVDDREIIYYGLYLSFKTQDPDYTEYFIRELYRIVKDESANRKIRLIKLMENVLNGREINEEIADIIEQNINKYNLDLLITVLEQQKNNEIKFRLFNYIHSLYPKNTEAIKNLALLYDQTGAISEALKFMENNKEIINNDPAALFYLASFYLKARKYSEAIHIFDHLENSFSQMGNIIQKVKLIKEKLKSIAV